jgi:hypothetical protein
MQSKEEEMSRKVSFELVGLKAIAALSDHSLAKVSIFFPPDHAAGWCPPRILQLFAAPA